MKKAPWAKFTMRVTPKMIERPEATRNSELALASPDIVDRSRIHRSTLSPSEASQGCRRLPWRINLRAQLLHLLVGRKIFGAVAIGKSTIMPLPSLSAVLPTNAPSVD